MDKRTLTKRYIIPAMLFFISIIFILTYYRSADSIFTNQYDDAYITYRYSVNLATGKGLVFNVGDRVDAASSFLYTVLLAMFYRIGMHDLEKLSGIIQLISTGLVAVLVYLSLLRITNNVYVSTGLSVLSFYHGMISGWAINGMETVFFIFLVMTFTWLTITRPESVAIPVSLVLIALARFEGIALVAVWMGFEAFRVMKRKRPLPMKKFLIRSGAILLVLAVYYASKYMYYHTLLPHSYHMKKIANYYQPNYRMFIKNWLIGASAVLILAASSLPFKQFRRYNLPMLFVYVALSGLSCMFGPRSDGGRYSAHLYPMLLLFAGIPLAGLLADRKFAVLASLAFAVALWQADNVAGSMKTFTVNLSKVQISRKQAGDYLNSKIDRSNIIISSDIGAIGYKAIDFTFIDLTGLTSLEVLGSYRSGNNIDKLLIDKHPAYIADTFHLDIHGDYTHRMLEPSGFLTTDVPKSSLESKWDITPVFTSKADSTTMISVAQISAGVYSPSPQTTE